MVDFFANAVSMEESGGGLSRFACLRPESLRRFSKKEKKMRTYLFSFLVSLLMATVTAAQEIKPRAAADGVPEPIDVNDISFLWPAPKTVKDANALISVDDLLADGKSPILPKDA